MSHPIESHLFVRRLVRLARSKNTKLHTCSERFLHDDCFKMWLCKAAETMGKTDTMNLGVVNTVIYILMDVSNGSMEKLGNDMRELHEIGATLRSDKFLNSSCLRFVWQFMFFWKKHYTDPGNYRLDFTIAPFQHTSHFRLIRMVTIIPCV